MGASQSTPTKTTITVLFVGTTGAGKTILVNYLANVLVLHHEPEYFKDIIDHANENQNVQPSVSTTQDAHVYEFQVGPVTVRFVDTPGISEGLEENARTGKVIIQRLQSVHTIDAVLLVVAGSNSRISASTTYMLTTIKGIFPKAIEDNIIVLLTNCDPISANFSVPSLGFKPAHVFHLQNPFAVWQKIPTLSQEHQKRGWLMLRRAHEDAMETIEQLATAVQQMRNCPTSSFKQLYELKSEVESQLIAAMDLVAQIRAKEKDISNIKAQLDAGKQVAELTKDFRSVINREWWVQDTRDFYTTLCGHPDCHSNCHSNCGLAMTTDKEAFLGCAAINGTTCRSCGHHYTLHFHGYKEWVLKREATENIDKQAQQKHQEAVKTVEQSESLAAALDLQMQQLRVQRHAFQAKVDKAIDDYGKLSFGGSMEVHICAMIQVVQLRLKTTTDIKQRDILNKDIARLTTKLDQLRKFRA